MNADTRPETVRAETVGCILAGGLSRRMGGCEKGLLPLADKPLLQHAIDRLAPQVGVTMLNANGDPSRFDAFGLPVAADPIEGFAGPLAGVLAGMRWAQAHAPQARFVATAAADTPFFPDDLVARLHAAAMAGADGEAAPAIALAASRGKTHPVFGLWPVTLADDLEAWFAQTETRKVLAWVDRHPHRAVEFEAGAADPFFNVNTPEDLAEAGRLAAGAPVEADA